MVSNAREDLPDPDTPVTTVRELWRIVKSMFFRLWTRAPRTTMLSVDICKRTAAISPVVPTTWSLVSRRARRAHGILLLYGTRRSCLAFAVPAPQFRSAHRTVFCPRRQYQGEHRA